jgi:hypothetical protein
VQVLREWLRWRCCEASQSLYSGDAQKHLNKHRQEWLQCSVRQISIYMVTSMIQNHSPKSHAYTFKFQSSICVQAYLKMKEIKAHMLTIILIS